LGTILIGAVITVPATEVGEIDGIPVLAGGWGTPAAEAAGGHSVLMALSGSAASCETAKTAGIKKKTVQKAKNSFTIYLISYTIIYLSGKYNNFVYFSLAIYHKCVIILLKENEYGRKST
jgi:hypothetical protein